MTKKIVVVDYDPVWAENFGQLREVYQTYLGDCVGDIQHVGSTSVPGLAAKPVLDIDLVIADRRKLTEITDRLQKLGYRHEGDKGIADREAFKRISENAPIDGSGRQWQKHHLYVCTQGSDGLRNHLTLRDYLRENPTIAQQYSDLKKQLAARFPNDSDKYVSGKTDFILNVLKEAGFQQETLQRISSQNR